MATLNPVPKDAPLLNPAPHGLFTVTDWTDETLLRWLPEGFTFRRVNYDNGAEFGVWTAPWNAAESELGPEDEKVGDRPADTDAFGALVTWAAAEGDLRSRDETVTRSMQKHRLAEPIQVEKHLAARMLTDATTVDSVADLVAAVSRLEAELAKTNTLGLIHASAHLAAYAAEAQLVVRSGTALKTPLGHTWVFGGGYVTALDTTLVATSQTYGWRGPVETRDAPSQRHNEHRVVTERSLVIGYEHLVAAVEIPGGEGE